MSLRSRLLLALAAVSLVALVAADLVVYAQLRSFLFSQIDSSLESAHAPVEQLARAGAERDNTLPGGGVGTPTTTVATAAGAASTPTTTTPATTSPGGPVRSLSPFCSAAAVALIPGSAVEVLDRDDRVLTGESCSNNLEGGTRYLPVLPARLAGFQPTGPRHDPVLYLTTASSPSGGPSFRVRLQVLPNGDYLMLAEPLGSTAGTLHRLLLVELLVTSGALALALGLGLVLVRAGLRPLRAVGQTADRITAGEFHSRVPGESTRTEVGHVAAALNSMLGRIEEAFGQRDATEAELRASEQRLKRFVADASHELRTPIAAISAYAELFDKASEGHEEDRARIMRGITRESYRMGRLVEDLLALARLDEHRPLRRQSVELVGLAAEAVQTAAAVGPEWPVLVEAAGPVEVPGDPLQLRQVLDNLLANVRAHTPAGTGATVSIEATTDGALIKVADDGPGIDPAIASQVFERFFRADPSRTRSTGGTGLGLGIVAAIVDAHGGSVSIGARRPDEVERRGTVIAIRLPGDTTATAGEVPAPD